MINEIFILIKNLKKLDVKNYKLYKYIYIYINNKLIFSINLLKNVTNFILLNIYNEILY